MKRLLLLPSLLLVSSMSFSQVGIGTDAPDPSAALDITSTNKGLLLPRVTLTDNVTDTPVTGATAGLLVYNDGANSNMPAGHYYWDGSEWKRFDYSNDAPPSIGDLQCSNAIFSPLTYTMNNAYDGTLSIPYTDGNGGRYSGELPKYTTNGSLTYTLLGDRLSQGPGNVVYRVQGIPAYSSPQTTLFDISFLGKSCTAEVGSGNKIDVVKYARRNVSPIDNRTVDESVTTIGNLQVRFNPFVGPLNGQTVTYDNAFGYIEVRTYEKDSHISFLFHKAGTGQAGLEVYGQLASVKQGDWHQLKVISYQGGAGNGLAENFNGGNRDLGYIIFVLHNTGEVYRVTINANGKIASSGNVAAKNSAITLFVEQLGSSEDIL